MRTLTTGEALDFLDRYRRGRETRDVDATMALYRPDADLREDPFADHVAGELAIRAWWNERAASTTNVEFDVERTWASGPTVLASWHGAWTRGDTAERIRARGFVTFELDDDLLVFRERHWTVMRPVGQDATVMPGAGATDGGRA